MKSKILFFFLLLSLNSVFAQSTATSTTPLTLPVPPTVEPTTLDDDNYGWAKRISFIVGAGPSVIYGKVFQDVAIDKSSNVVLIESADKLRTPVSLGIIYTPFVSDIRRRIKTSDSDSTIIYDHYPKGFSVGLFLNPFELSSVNATQSSQVDLGFGLGYRAGAFSFLATTEFFSLRQARKSFIDKYRGKNLPYTVNSEVQTSINVNEESVYRSKKFVSFGLKIAYTFDIVKSYYTSSR